MPLKKKNLYKMLKIKCNVYIFIISTVKNKIKVNFLSIMKS